MSKTRCYSIDLYKFILSLVVLTLHYNWHFTPQGYLAVETFFLIAGFFSALNKKLTEQKSLFSLCINKFKKIYPLYAVVIIIWAIVIFVFYQNADLIKQLPAYLSMFYAFTTKGAGYNYIGDLEHLWFIPIYFLCYLIIAFISKNFDRQKSAFACLIITVISASLLVYFSESGGLNYTIGEILPIHIGVLRGLMDMSIGYIAGILCQKCQNAFENEKQVPRVLICSIFEVLAIIYSVYVITADVSILYDYSYIIVSALLIVLLYLNNGVIARTMNKLSCTKFVKYITSLSMAIYMVHYLVIHVYQLVASQDNSEQGLLICMGISIVLASGLEMLNIFIQKKILTKLLSASQKQIL